MISDPNDESPANVDAAVSNMYIFFKIYPSNTCKTFQRVLFYLER